MSGKKRILIVDDEEDLCFILSKNFEILGGFDVSYALTGQQALSQVRSFAPDLVFLDIGLQDIDGISLIKRMLALNSNLRIIILTGKGTHDYVETAFKAGAVDFALKPCETKKLIALVKKHIPEGPENQELKSPKTARFTKILFLDILASFVSASEAKSKYLKGHSERVADLSKKIGQKLGFNQDQLDVLEYSAIMHDVGKIGVKDEILDKEAK
ncbi:MAG TPA: response regulator, partial [Candidatus Omnitrophota bacterium]|nr:response regulator [Candidatus Omnitrophota bacterium]